MNIGDSRKKAVFFRAWWIPMDPMILLSSSKRRPLTRGRSSQLLATYGVVATDDGHQSRRSLCPDSRRHPDLLTASSTRLYPATPLYRQGPQVLHQRFASFLQQTNKIVVTKQTLVHRLQEVRDNPTLGQGRQLHRTSDLQRHRRREERLPTASNTRSYPWGR